MSSKTKSKAKKPLETTLGKAPSAEKIVDLSHVRKPIQTSIFGLKQILTLFETATDEVQNYISHECDVMFECKICRTIFRSLANFILHKRNYCREKYTCFASGNGSGCLEDAKGFVIDEECQNVEPTSSRATTPEVNDNKSKKLCPVIDKLLRKHEVQVLAQNALNEDLTKEDDDNELELNQGQKLAENDVLLQKIDTSNSAVFQTVFNKQQNSSKEMMKNEVMEIHGIFDSDEVVLDADGKICSFETSKINAKSNIPKQDLMCSECNIKFATKKTLTYHIKYKHNSTKIVYSCPICKDTLANTWCVYRHLYKVHRRTSAQIRRMRDQIHCNKIRRDEEPAKKEVKQVEQKNDENQWLDNFEGDNDLQMCGGCGRKFERKAALNSHSQMCTKRIAVCNTIKASNAKTKPRKPPKLVKLPLNKVEPAKSSNKRKSKPLKVTQVESKFDSDLNLEFLDKKNVLDIIGAPTTSFCRDPIEIDSDDCCEIGNTIEFANCDILESGSPTNEAPSILIEDSNSLPDSDDIIALSDDNSDSDETNQFPPELHNEIDLNQKFNSYEKSYIIGNFPGCLKTKQMLSFDNQDMCQSDEDEDFVTKSSSYMDESKLQCNSCRVSYASRYQLLWHMSLHFSWFRFQCSRCSFMSFNKYECVTHAHLNHSIPNHLMESTVLPIANWKTVLMSHDFRELQQEFDKTDGKKMEQDALEAVGNSKLETSGTKAYTNCKTTPSSSGSSEDGLKPEEIFVANNSDEMNGSFISDVSGCKDQNEDPLQIENGVATVMNLGDFNKEEKIVELEESAAAVSNSEKGAKSDADASSPSNKKSKVVVPSKVRPSRLRTKSFKIIQNDFIYDLNKVLKLNVKGSIKPKKTQSSGKYAVKSLVGKTAVSKDELKKK